MHALWIATLSLFLASCQYDPYAHLYTTEEPKDTDVSGRYDISDQTFTRDRLAFLQGKPCFMEIHSDHTFTAMNFPDWRETRPIEYALDGLRTRSGTWSIESVGSIDDGSRPLKTHWGIRFDTGSNDLWAAGFTGRKPPYGLIFGYGDPDSGTVMRFTKSQ